MIPRILEPEVMDTFEEAVDYNTMDHSLVNRVFVDDLLTALSLAGLRAADAFTSVRLRVLDVGTGTALIPLELCARPGDWQITAIDLAGAMLAIAEQNVAAKGLQQRISLQKVDAKELPFADASFDAVMSNSIIHHIPQPKLSLREMTRVVRRAGILFVRDLLRPTSTEEVERLVSLYAADANARQRAMFRASLHAALTVEEVQAMAALLGVNSKHVRQTSDRHWTLFWRA